MTADFFFSIWRILFFCSLPVALISPLMTYFFKKKYGGVRWTVVQATVLSSKVEEVLYGYGQNPRRQYAPEISCRYEFRGRQYQEVVPCPDPAWTAAAWKSYAENWVSMFSEGMQLSLYIDPDEPTKVVFFPHFTSNWGYAIAHAFAFIGLLTGVIPAVMWLLLGSL